MKTKNSFPVSTIEYLKLLSENNNTEWFNTNKSLYENDLLAPAREFVTTVGMKLKEIMPGLIAEPKVNKSIFRLNRDTRFSENKSPYKKNLGILMWEGSVGRNQSSGFYLHIEPGNCFYANGIYFMDKPLLEKYRVFIKNSQNSIELLEILRKLESSNFSIGGKTLKRLPKELANLSEELKNLGLHTGVYAFKNIPEETIVSPDFAEKMFVNYLELIELHKWLFDFTES